MSFAQNIEAVRSRDLRQRYQLFLLKGGDNEQDGVSAVGLGFHDLEFINDEIFAQAGKRTARGGLAQIIQRALEKLFVGQHRQCGGASLLEFLGEFGWFEIGANQASRGRGFFQFGNDGDRDSVLRDPAQLIPKSARDVLRGRALQCSQVAASPIQREALARGGDNRVQGGWHGRRSIIRNWPSCGAKEQLLRADFSAGRSVRANGKSETYDPPAAKRQSQKARHGSAGQLQMEPSQSCKGRHLGGLVTRSEAASCAVMRAVDPPSAKML